MPTYAVTGASGHLGRLAVEELLARSVPGSDVVAVVRTRAKAADLADRGVQVREADYSRPHTLGPALAGVEQLLLVSSSEAGRESPTTPTSSRLQRRQEPLASCTRAC